MYICVRLRLWFKCFWFLSIKTINAIIFLMLLQLFTLMFSYTTESRLVYLWTSSLEAIGSHWHLCTNNQVSTHITSQLNIRVVHVIILEVSGKMGKFSYLTSCFCENTFVLNNSSRLFASLVCNIDIIHLPSVSIALRN